MKYCIYLNIISYFIFLGCNPKTSKEIKTIKAEGAAEQVAEDCNPLNDLRCENQATTRPVETVAPFTCTTKAASLNELVKAYAEPSTVLSGDTFAIAVKSKSSHAEDGMKPTLEFTSRRGTSTINPVFQTNSSFSMFYFQIPKVEAGELCFSVNYQGVTEISQKITVTNSPTTYPTTGVFKLISNHQITCSEGANGDPYLQVKVIDEQNNPMSGIKLSIKNSAFVDGGSFHGNEQGLQDSINKGQSFSTNGEGIFRTSIFSPISKSPTGDSALGAGLNFYTIEISDSNRASDIGVGISTGWWQNINNVELSCGYMSNVYGHWAHSLVFQLQSNALQRCKVHNDLAALNGQVPFIFYNGQSQPCWTIQ